MPVTDAAPGVVPRLLPWPKDLPKAVSDDKGTCFPKPLDDVAASRLVACEQLGDLGQKACNAGLDLQKARYESQLRLKDEQSWADHMAQTLKRGTGPLWFVAGALVGGYVAYRLSR